MSLSISKGQYDYSLFPTLPPMLELSFSGASASFRVDIGIRTVGVRTVGFIVRVFPRIITQSRPLDHGQQ